MTEEEQYIVAYGLYSRDYIKEYDMSPMTIWGFANIIPDYIRKKYLDKAKLSIRTKKINEIKQKYESR